MGAWGKRWKTKCPFNFTKIILTIYFLFWDYNVIISFPPSLSSIHNSPYFPLCFGGTMLLVSLVVLHVLSLVMSLMQYATSHMPAGGRTQNSVREREQSTCGCRPMGWVHPFIWECNSSPQHKPVHWGHQSSLPFTMTPPRTTNSSVFHPLDILANWK